MPTIKTRNDAAATGDVVTPWTGNQYEYLPFNALVEIALKADAGDTFFASVFSGSDVLLQNSQIDELAVATPITYPEDYDISDIAAQGERLGCQLTNQSAGAATVRTVARITPL